MVFSLLFQDTLLTVVVSFARLSTLSVVGDEIFSFWLKSTPAVKKAVGGGSSLLPYPLSRGTLLSGRFETLTN